ADRGADIDRRTRLAVRDIAPAIFEEGLVARVRPQDLIALPAARTGRRDRAGADDLSLRHGLVEARERRLLGAAEAKAPVALRVGAAGTPARAGVDPAASLRRGDLLGRAEGADHVFVVGARGIDRADVDALAHRKRQADAVAVLLLALAIGDAVIHVAACGGAEGVGLVLAHLERRAGHRVEKLVEAGPGKLANLVLHALFHAPDVGQHIRAQAPDIAG